MPTFQRNGKTIGYKIIGSGDPVLLFHGTTQAASGWDQVIQPVADQRTWIVFEFPGSGESSMPDGPIELDDIADDAAELMNSLGHSHFHVGGYSLGAVVALHLSARFPERVLTTTSLCGWSVSDARMKATFDLWRRLIAISPELFMRYALVDGYTAAALEMIHPMIEQVVPLAATTVQPGSDAHLELDERVNIEDSLRRITSPCLVIGGTEDRWVDIQHSRHIADTVKNAELIELPAGHLVITERADEIAAHILRHTSQHQ